MLFNGLPMLRRSPIAEKRPSWFFPARHGVIALLLWPVVAVAQVAIPSGADWTNRGRIHTQGEPGEWDAYMPGNLASPGGVVKLDGTYYLYYVGGDGERPLRGNEGPAHRKVGVLTSSDGIHFKEHPSNPILAYSPFGCDEEGIFSVAPVLHQGRIYLYYGAMHALNRSPNCASVDSSIRVAVSTDGVTFSRDEELVNGRTDACTGCGTKEIYPIGAFRRATDGSWFVYYNDGAPSWDLYLIQGAAYNDLSIGEATDRRVLAHDDHLWNMGPPARVGPGRLALFIGEHPGGAPSRAIKVYTIDVNDPFTMGEAPDEIYDSRDPAFADSMMASTYLDATDWKMYYAGCQSGPCPTGATDEYNVRTAPRVETVEAPR